MEEIGAKIDSLAEQVGRIAASINGLNTIGRAIHEEAGSLSTQAREMLKMFADSNDRMSLWAVGAAAIREFPNLGLPFPLFYRPA